MKSILTTKSKKNFTGKNEIIILNFTEDDNIDDLIREFEEDKMLSRENEAINMVTEINFLNSIRFNNLSRVA
ncbi:MAG: hypothetical protein H0V01_02770 [Bacteroidetes bacterium]|nr:hypothetical protein [Bacteroidota bacterium]HET6244733.1 hypothetical protein [Bacteroidia bacterium]